MKENRSSFPRWEQLRLTPGALGGARHGGGQDFRIVLPQAWCGPADWRALPVEAGRQADELTESGDCVQYSPRCGLRLSCSLGKIVDRRARNPRCLKTFDPFGPALRAHERLDVGQQRILIGDPERVRFEARIGVPLWMPERLRKFREQAVVGGRADDFPVARLKSLEDDDARRAGAVAGWKTAQGFVGAETDGEPAERRFEQRGVDRAPCARKLALVESRNAADGRPHAGSKVKYRKCDARRRSAGGAIYRKNAGKGLYDRLVARRHFHRTFAAEGPQRAVNETRVGGPKCLDVEPKFVHGARAQILHQHVAPGDVFFEPADRGRISQVDGDAALVVVECMKEMRCVCRQRRPPDARVVATVGTLDLHDIGAQARENLPSERPR